jgi:hypothetical protein
MNSVVVRIKGGLGNQLFCYAAARRLALVNNAQLIIDDVSGFSRDSQYRRKYMLDKFKIPIRKATPTERLEPFERCRRGIMKWLSRHKRFENREYIEQEGHDFDERLLSLKVNGTIYLDGYWQSEDYFKDVEHTIRQDLQIVPPTGSENHYTADQIRKCNSVALHVRWFDNPGAPATHNAAEDYYVRAIGLIEAKTDLPWYFIFSDKPEAVHSRLTLPKERVSFVLHNRGDENAYADLWLMMQCRHFITANSTFSWWGAWLGERA